MKVLTPQEIQNTKDVELAKHLNRLSTTKEALAEAQKELALNDAQFEVRLANQRQRWVQEEKEALMRIEALNNEIRRLETEQKKALIPIELLNKEAHTNLEQAKRELSIAESKRLEAEILADTLTEKIDGYTEKEQQLKDREAKLAVKEKAVESQGEMVKNLSKELTSKWEEYFKKIENHGSDTRI